MINYRLKNCFDRCIVLLGFSVLTTKYGWLKKHKSFNNRIKYRAGVTAM